MLLKGGDLALLRPGAWHRVFSLTSKAAAARRCQIERRDLEFQIAGELVERFPEFGYVDTDVRMIDNKTLRMDLREGKMWALANKARLTTAWWAATVATIDVGDKDGVVGSAGECLFCHDLWCMCVVTRACACACGSLASPVPCSLQTVLCRDPSLAVI